MFPLTVSIYLYMVQFGGNFLHWQYSARHNKLSPKELGYFSKRRALFVIKSLSKQSIGKYELCLQSFTTHIYEDSTLKLDGISLESPRMPRSEIKFNTG